MDSNEKKRLVFDLTKEEYNDFLDDVQELGSTKIGLFRKMWSNHRMMPIFNGTRKDYGPAAQCRMRYIGLAYSILNLLTTTNQTGKAISFINTAEQDWDLWANRLKEVAEYLAAVPLGTSDENFSPPNAPNWFGLGNLDINAFKTTDLESEV